MAGESLAGETAMNIWKRAQIDAAPGAGSEPKSG
jgi:hypothetical protein